MDTIIQSRKSHFKSIHSCLPKWLLLALAFLPLSAIAQYDLQIVSPPGAAFSQAFGLNEHGKVTGGFNDGVENRDFIYDIKTGTYETFSTQAFGLDINNAGSMVGDVEGVCAIRDKHDNITALSPPSYTVDSNCQVRGINSSGQVTGFMVDALGLWLGFSYNPKKDSYEEFLPSAQTISHEINAKGLIAGSVFLEADDAFSGSAPGRYGFVRDKSGEFKYFSISQALPGQTRARGISESGLVTGFYLDPATFELASFVSALSKGNDYEEVTLTPEQIIYQKPCNPDTPPAPSADYQLFTNLTASRVRNDGVVVGSCSDVYFDATTGDVVQYGYGFLATPSD